MSEYMRVILASLAQNLQSLQYRAQNVQLPSASFYVNKGNNIHAKYPKAFILLAVLVLLLFWKDILVNSWGGFAAKVRQAPTLLGDDNPILNATLGFQDIYVLALPDRGDRKAPLLAGANATNLSITVIDAIRDRQIPQSDWPEYWGTNGWVPKEGELGCLMSHLRTWRKIMHENISSALIMESDVDWDLRIKQTMVSVAEGVKAIADWPFDPPTPAPVNATRHPKDISIPPQPGPYGDKWDLIWIGHCGSTVKDPSRVYSFNDVSAPDENHAWSYGYRPGTDERAEGTRIVYHTNSAVCTTSYAISNAGAHKLEKLFKEANGPIDLKMWDICGNSKEVLCVGVWPQVIVMTESRGNIKHSEGGLSFGHEIEEEKIVAGNSIQVSARVNANLGTAGKGPEGWKWEWQSGEGKREEGGEEEKVEEGKAQEEEPEQTD